MTLSAARIIFGLAPDEDPRPHLADIRLARERIAEWVRTAPDEALADRYQEGLIEFDQALAAILESLEESEPQPPPVPPPPGKPLMRIAAVPQAILAAGETAPQTVAQPAPEPAPRRRSFAWIGWLLVMAMLTVGGVYLYDQYLQDQALQVLIIQIDPAHG